MTLLDANILVYAYVTQMPEHVAAKRWIDDHLTRMPLVGLPWPSLLAFMRLTTNAKMFEHPKSSAGAWAVVTSLLARENTWIPQPTPRHHVVLGELIAATAAAGNAFPDAHLAAIAIEHDLSVVTAGRGFAPFPGVRVLNPLRSLR